MKPIDSRRGRPLKIRKKKPKFQENLAQYFSDYSNNTTIHGMKYLGEKNRSIAEKYRWLWWLILMSISLYMCAYLIIKTYEKWETSPVIVTFAKSPTPIWKIPFPAITICPETKCRQRVYNYTEAYHKYSQGNMTEIELKEFEQVGLVCYFLTGGGSETIGYETIDFLSKIAPQFGDVFWQCKWINQNQTCYNLLTPILTEEGVCFTFNMLDREEMFTNVVFHKGNYLDHGVTSLNWTLENGYPNNLEAATFPRRAIAAGETACFSLLMNLNEHDLDYICKGPVQGFKIVMHDPSEMPRVSQFYFRAPLNQEVVVAIKPDMMTTSENLRDYKPEDRNCYFLHEKRLKYFKLYTQRNCEVECLTNRTLERCGCVSYHMPHDEATELCGTGSYYCVLSAKAEMLEQEMLMDMESFHGDNFDLASKTRCNCLPACTSLSYNAEYSQAEYNWIKVLEAFNENLTEVEGFALTRVTFFFKEQQFITSERNELHGLTDFLANCGGLLGLFIGFSFLSMIEILYFVTLRLFCNIKKYGRHFWSGSPDEDYEHNN